jgi:ABC-2 type transport system permease protein
MFPLTEDKKIFFSLWRYARLTWEVAKRNILSAMEYRTAFLMQVIGMIINDFALIFAWVIFFQRFPEVNGWSFQDSVILFALGTISFGLVFTLARGSLDIARGISNGDLDYFLSFPVDTLWYTSVSRTDISAIGDFLFGFIILFWAGNLPLEKFPLFLLLCFLSGLIFLNFIIITQSIAFWVGRFEDAAEQIFHAALGFTLYPQNVFRGALKLIMMTVLPVFFVTTIPVNLIRSFDWKLLGAMLLFWVGSSFLAVFIFKKGLRRYESGNLISVRM